MFDPGNQVAGRVALVTGANRGIGRAIAIALARAGAAVAVHYRTHAEEAAAVCDAIEHLGQRAIAVAADVSRSAEVRDLVVAIEQRLGPIDVLVNNAGVATPRPIEELTEEDWDASATVNLKSAFLITQAVLPGMRARRFGRIVNLASIAAHTGGIVGPHYAAAKAGLLGLTHAYAARLAPEGITVNAISPALIATDMLAGNPRARPESVPVGRLGTAEEVAVVALTLIGSPYVTGQTIHVNGGMYPT